MKKLLAFTLCFVMVLSCSIPAFAAELPYNKATGQSTVTYQVDSSFCVIIPETVDAFNGFQLTASNMNITEAEQVNVSVNGENSIPMTNDEGEMPAAGYYTGTVEFVVELGVKPPQY